MNIGRPAVIEIPPRVFRARLTGLLFDTDKTFLLPSALDGLRALRRLFEQHPDVAVLVVGHTDTAAILAWACTAGLALSSCVPPERAPAPALPAGAALAPALGASADPAASGDVRMMETLPEARALLSRSARIVHVAIASAAPEAWVEERPMLFRRDVALVLRPIQTFKGAGPTAGGAEVRTRTVQYELRSIIGSAVPGAWSGLSLDAGKEYVVFCKSAGDLAADLGAASHVFVAELALLDVKLAHLAETTKRPVAEVVGGIRAEAGRLWWLFPEWLWERHGAAAIADAATAEAMLDPIRWPDTSELARGTFMYEANQAIFGAGTTPEGMRLRDQTVRAFLATLSIGAAAAIHPTAVNDHLPGLLGFTSGMPEPCAHDVFAGHEPEKRAAEAALRSVASPAAPAKLLEWITAAECR